MSGGVGGVIGSCLKFPKGTAEGSVIGGVESDPMLTKYKPLHPPTLSEALPTLTVTDNNNIPAPTTLIVTNGGRPIMPPDSLLVIFLRSYVYLMVVLLIYFPFFKKNSYL